MTLREQRGGDGQRRSSPFPDISSPIPDKTLTVSGPGAIVAPVIFCHAGTWGLRMGNLLRRLHAAASPEMVRGCESVRPARDVLSARIDERCVLLDLRAEVYVGLDDIGSRIWTAVERRHSSEQLIADLTSEYDASREVLEHDTREFLRDLYRRRLVVLA